MNKKNEQYQQRKWQLLRIGLEQFIQYGYFGTSTRKIAEIAGISTGLLFHYFKTKEDLYFELVKIGCAKMEIQDKNLAPLDFFKREIDIFFKTIEKNDFSTKMFVFMGLAVINAKTISKKSWELIEQYNIERQSIEFIKKGQELGQIREGNPEAISALFYSSMQGLAEYASKNRNTPLPKKEWILDIIRCR